MVLFQKAKGFHGWLFLTLCLLGTQLACAILTSEKVGATPSPFPNLTPSRPNPTAIISESLEYRNEVFGFSFLYPADLILRETTDRQSILLVFPRPLNTNWVEEQLLVRVQNSPPCFTSLAEGRNEAQLTEQAVVISGLNFLRQNFSGAAAGTTTEMVAYLTNQDEMCISFDFLLRTFDPDNLDPTAFPNAPTAIDRPQEVQVFEGIVSTFKWLQ